MNLRQGEAQVNGRDSSFSWSRMNNRILTASFAFVIAASLIIQGNGKLVVATLCWCSLIGARSAVLITIRTMVFVCLGLFIDRCLSTIAVVTDWTQRIPENPPPGSA